MKGPLVDGLYTEKWYNNEAVSEFGYILHESRLLGIPRIRQIKVRLGKTGQNCPNKIGIFQAPLRKSKYHKGFVVPLRFKESHKAYAQSTDFPFIIGDGRIS